MSNLSKGQYLALVVAEGNGKAKAAALVEEALVLDGAGR